MNPLLQNLQDDVWQTIRTHLPPGRRLVAGTRFVGINCPMCVHRGQRRADTRHRCGLRSDASGIGINCFNCTFTTRWRVGDPLSRNLRQFLERLGVDRHVIGRLALRIAQAAKPNTTVVVRSSFDPDTSFPPCPLPEDAYPLAFWCEQQLDDPHFLAALAHVAARGIEGDTTTYYWTPSLDHDMNRRVIVPFTYKGTVVGYGARSVDATKPKYITDAPPNYLFNNHVMRLERKYIILVEGVFDAIAIDGVGCQGVHLNGDQAHWIDSHQKELIVVPDQDEPGRQLVDVALRHGWAVSFPRSPRKLWDGDIKDCAAAVQRYGRLYTLRSILASAVTSRSQIQILKSTLGGH